MSPSRFTISIIVRYGALLMWLPLPQNQQDLDLPLVSLFGLVHVITVLIWPTRILPMFHAAGWTYPWANTFAFATQVCLHAIPT